MCRQSASFDWSMIHRLERGINPHEFAMSSCLLPKGERTETRHNYGIGKESVRLLEKTAQMLCEHYQLQPGNPLPRIAFEPLHQRSHRFEGMHLPLHLSIQPDPPLCFDDYAMYSFSPPWNAVSDECWSPGGHETASAAPCVCDVCSSG